MSEKAALSPNRIYDVLMIAPTMFFADYGSHVRILEEAVALRDMGHHITILAYPNGRDIAGLDVRRCWGVPFNYRVIVGSSRHKIYLDVMLGLKALSTVLGHRPAVIHAHLHEGALIGHVLSKLRGVPLVFDFQGSMTSEMIDHHFLRRESVLYRPLRRLEWLIDRFPAAVITSSHHAANILINEFECSPQKVYPVPDCVNVNTFRPDVLGTEEKQALQARWNIPPDRSLVVYLGLLAEYQGTGLLLQAAQRVVSARPDTHFLIMGFPNVEEYRGLAQRLGLNEHMTFTGQLPYEDAPRYLALGDVAVAPKVSATEGCGKLLNYMAMGLPTVAFPTPVSREYLDDLGVYAREISPAALADALLALLNDPREAAERGTKLRERAVKKYSWERGSQLIQEVYDNVCSHG
ncbi:MAG: glycosyltransferase family 4 protein [Anaerolineae bacterium]|nr:glycosyltransferase family 4 protein [Anaerolineae bacterium]